jgi:hypothetical protein
MAAINGINNVSASASEERRSWPGERKSIAAASAWRRGGGENKPYRAGYLKKTEEKKKK